MAGDWTAIEHTTPRKSEIASIAHDTGRSRHEVLGLLVEFWGWVETQTKTGKVQMPLSCLPSFVGADAQFWCAVVRAGWIHVEPSETPETSTSFTIPRANHWLSKGAKARLAKNRRQSRWRRKTRRDVDARPSTKPSTTEQKRREQKSIKEPSYDGSSGEAANQEAAVLVFPCSGDGARTWDVTESKLSEWRGSYPGIDVLSECRKALQWCRDNPTRIKTARGTPAFISRWLSKAQDQSKGLFNGTATGGTGHRETAAEARERGNVNAVAGFLRRAELRKGNAGADSDETHGGLHGTAIDSVARRVERVQADDNQSGGTDDLRQ